MTNAAYWFRSSSPPLCLCAHQSYSQKGSGDVLISRSHNGKKRNQPRGTSFHSFPVSSALSTTPAFLAPVDFHTYHLQSWVWANMPPSPTHRLSYKFFFQDENLLGLGLYLKTHVYLGSQSSVARELLQPACEADPRDSPASLLPLPLWEPFHLISSRAKERDEPSWLLLNPSPLHCLCTAVLSCLIL